VYTCRRPFCLSNITLLSLTLTVFLSKCFISQRLPGMYHSWIPTLFVPVRLLGLYLQNHCLSNSSFSLVYDRPFILLRFLCSNESIDSFFLAPSSLLLSSCNLLQLQQLGVLRRHSPNSYYDSFRILLLVPTTRLISHWQDIPDS
jgi:hypothetical protein